MAHFHTNWHIVVPLEASAAIAMRASGFVMCASNSEVSESEYFCCCKHNLCDTKAKYIVKPTSLSEYNAMIYA
jgi:hypothetical protein